MLYEAKCKKCGWVYEVSGTSNIEGMPAICEKCSGDMTVALLDNEEKKDLTFEISIFCKETGVSIMGSFILIPKTLSLPKDKVVALAQESAAINFLKLIGAGTNTSDEQFRRVIFGR